MELDVATTFEAVARAIPERDCIVWRQRRSSWAESADRVRRLASVLAAAGLGCHGDPASVDGSTSVQDHVALYLTNGNEYLEAMIGGFRARVAPCNVNYRYVADELTYVLDDSAARAIVFHARYAPTLAEVLPRLARPPVLLLQVADESGNPLLDGALDYEAALAQADPAGPPDRPTPDDLYIVYTGGTTGMPKGVLWRQQDFLQGCLGFRRRDGQPFRSLDEVAAAAAASDGRLRALPSAPLMHGAAHWNAISCLLAGGTVVLQDRTDRLDPVDVLTTAAQQRCTSLQIVGDAFSRPLLDELAAHRDRYDLSHLRHLVSGGAVLSSAQKQQWTDAVEGLTVIDIVGSSDSGRQGIGTGTAAGTFEPSGTAAVLDEALTRRLVPGEDAVGWLAQAGPTPRGYLGDPDKTARTFPVVDGVRYAVAGDRARLSATGAIELLGRESVTINTGGEKVFAEEVELALKAHPDVYDTLVVGRPSPRWGQEVVAVVRLRDGVDPTASDESGASVDERLRATAAASLARYKLPKAFVYRDHIERSPSGKPDYAWARAQVGDGPGGAGDR